MDEDIKNEQISLLSLHCQIITFLGCVSATLISVLNGYFLNIAYPLLIALFTLVPVILNVNFSKKYGVDLIYKGIALNIFWKILLFAVLLIFIIYTNQYFYINNNSSIDLKYLSSQVSENGILWVLFDNLLKIFRCFLIYFITIIEAVALYGVTLMMIIPIRAQKILEKKRDYDQ
ncbi:hypothetical protein [Floricoccus penangensis]|uniref:hypothetical protein n=1 Tax=Floricoccus penangensis TaxID=1859475 RepID=UPI00203A5157|nr:hypothetical protein [Floricoccus penangensis]URZ87876.1 hypothetical protein KIW23_02170 [Floricoccus penangensis]